LIEPVLCGRRHDRHRSRQLGEQTAFDARGDQGDIHRHRAFVAPPDRVRTDAIEPVRAGDLRAAFEDRRPDVDRDLVDTTAPDGGLDVMQRTAHERADERRELSLWHDATHATQLVAVVIDRQDLARRDVDASVLLAEVARIEVRREHDRLRGSTKHVLELEPQHD
jgi:hypothetical protein